VMRWLLDLVLSSIGKKLLMALTGLFFCSFLAVHLAGNLTLYAGARVFDSYAEHLHSLGPVLAVAEPGMLLFALVHVSTGLFLFFQNLRARPARYIMNRAAGGRTPGSRTMPYTGLVLLAFVVYHLLGFHFVDKGSRTIFEIVSHAFSNPAVAGIYVLAMIAAGLHVSHGFWSAFQTLGASHPRYTPLIRGAGLLFSLAVGLGFGSIPLYLLFAA
jgi:succinate dehydrogenase / fumarate reductase, cytochrome b subunit